MKGLGPEFKVGIFTLVGVAATLFAIFVLSPNLFKSQESTRYYTHLPDASGLMRKTQVKTNGVTVGNVVEVELDGNLTKVSFEVRGNVRIPIGSTIEVRTVGFLGDKFLEIKRADNAQFIPPGELVPRRTGVYGMEEIFEKVGKVTESLADVLGTEEGKRSLANIVHNIEDITAEVKNIVNENRTGIRETIANVNSTSAALKRALGDKPESLEQIVENVRKFTASLNEVLDDENKQKVSRILASLDETITEFKGAGRNINLISAKVEKGEGTIGRLVNDDKALNELEGALKDIRKALAPVNNLQVAVDFHGEIRNDKSSQNYFNLEFHTRPDTFYLVGFTDKAHEIVETETELVGDPDPSGKTSKTKETIKRERQLQFNVQFAKRWYFAGVRFGLFESTGGIGTDLYAFKDRLKLTFEAFDFSGKDESIRRFAHLKAYASVLFFNHVYLLVGVDDVTKRDSDTGKTVKPISFFGGGLTFNDQDLKALFGTAAVAVGSN